MSFRHDNLRLGLCELLSLPFFVLCDKLLAASLVSVHVSAVQCILLLLCVHLSLFSDVVVRHGIAIDIVIDVFALLCKSQGFPVPCKLVLLCLCQSRIASFFLFFFDDLLPQQHELLRRSLLQIVLPRSQPECLHLFGRQLSSLRSAISVCLFAL